MNDTEFVRMMASIILASAPLIIAVCGPSVAEIALEFGPA